MTKLDRRTFLKAGAASLALPMMPSISRAAENGQYPKRLVVVFTPNGTVQEAWKPIETNDGFELNTILEPLQPFKDRISILEGVDNIIAGKQYGPGNSHPRGINSILTGHPLNDGNFSSGGGGLGWSKGISIDQYIANQLSLEDSYRFGTLELGAVSSGPPPHTTMVFKGDNQPKMPDDDPFSVFDRLFSDDSGGDPRAQKLRGMRRNVLDLVTDDLKRFKKRVSADEVSRVEAHAESIGRLQNRITNLASCDNPPSVPGGINKDSRAQLPEILDIQTDLLVKALSCQLTTVATFLWTRSTNMVPFTWLHEYGSQDEYKSIKHHNLSHNDGNSAARQKLIDINRWWSKRFRDLLSRMDAVPEPTVEDPEATMLDHTLVLWVNELGTGTEHWLKEIPIVMAGGAHNTFKMGEHFKFSGSRSHQDLLTAICHGFDAPIDKFGDSRTCDGRMDEILV